MRLASSVIRHADGYAMHARGLRRTYFTGGGVPIIALDGVDLDLDPGSITAVTGPSGSGKSTLLHVLGGMDRADEGTITADGAAITAMSRSRLVAYRRTVGFVFQHFALLSALTALDNVMLPVLPYHTPYDRRDRATGLLSEVGLTGREDALPFQLSGGQRQRVAIARALINSPRLLLADEPTGNLDSGTGIAILDLLLALRHEYKLTIVIGTHDMGLAARCDRDIALRDGRITS